MLERRQAERIRQGFRTAPGACEHVFGECSRFPYAAFRRAIEARSLTRAITEARDLPQISLADAAELVVLAADDHGSSFDRWAGRWAARYVLEEHNVTLGEAQLVLAGLAGLREADRQSAALALVAVFAARNRPELGRPFRRLVVEDAAE